MAQTYSSMSVDELDVKKLEIKTKIDALREEYRDLNEYRKAAVQADREADLAAAQGKPGIVTEAKPMGAQ